MASCIVTDVSSSDVSSSDVSSSDVSSRVECPQCREIPDGYPSQRESFRWAMVHFGSADLGDKRRTRRLVQVAASLTESPHMSLPKTFPAWTALVGAYRLLSNKQIDPQEILRPHISWTRQQAAAYPVVLCVQDDTPLDFTLRTAIHGLGKIGDGKGRGLLQHGALAVLPDKRLLGILDLRWFAPEGRPAGETRSARQQRWTLRDVWHEAAQQIGRIDHFDSWSPATASSSSSSSSFQLIHVGDRHADIFRFLREASGLGHGFVVRAMHNRSLAPALASHSAPALASHSAPALTSHSAPALTSHSASHLASQEAQLPEEHEASGMSLDHEHLWERLSRQPVLGSMTVTLGEQRDKGNQVKRAAREAILSIRSAPITLPAPKNDPRTKGLGELSLWAVFLREEEVPERQEPQEPQERVEWMLLTSLEVGTLEEARTVAGYYTCRWVIEEWHRCLKEGCRIEAAQLDDAQDIQRLTAILSVVAVRLLQMRDLADDASPAADDPEALQERVPELYVAVVAGLAKRDVATLTPRQFWRTVAKRGGYLGRKHDPRPGWKVLWRGWSEIVQMVRGIELYQQVLNNRYSTTGETSKSN